METPDIAMHPGLAATEALGPGAHQHQPLAPCDSRHLFEQRASFGPSRRVMSKDDACPARQRLDRRQELVAHPLVSHQP